MPLFYSLSVNHNFDDYIKSAESVKWQGWIAILKRHISDKQQLDKLINNIESGGLSSHMGKSLFPSVQHIIRLLRDINRRKTLDNSTTKQLAYQHQPKDKIIIDKLREEQSDRPEGYWDDFDSTRFKNEGKLYMDTYINSKSGTIR
jgi:hypothetical protein